jgi:cytochrome c peroxidase
MNMKTKLLLPLFAATLLLAACGEDDINEPIDAYTRYDNEPLTQFAYNPEAASLGTLTGFPQPIIPNDNPFTKAGIELGRRLFYDPILSGDSTMSCESCHKQSLAFSDGMSKSIGIDGIAGTRNAPPLMNLAFVSNGLNWDGSSPNLEEQAIIPITSEIEMHAEFKDVVLRLKRHSLYPKWFREAFGIEQKGEINDLLVRKALSQFVRTLISSKSKIDRANGLVPGAPRPFLTDSEQRGSIMFFKENDVIFTWDGRDSIRNDKECMHCHGGANRLFTNNAFTNNGLTASQGFFDFPDFGLGAITGRAPDNGRFRTPSLRNIELTAPYMHDGRFQTLEEVLDHYADHLKDSPNLDGILSARLSGVKISFTQTEKTDLINFMKALTDTTFVNNPAFSNPWK